jgi:hypothetical protein
MGSAMDFDLPISTGSGTYGCAEAYDEVSNTSLAAYQHHNLL